MKKTSYLCNLCYNEIDKNDDGNGVNFAQGHILLVNISQADKHLCNNCMELLVVPLTKRKNV